MGDNHIATLEIQAAHNDQDRTFRCKVQSGSDTAAVVTASFNVYGMLLQAFMNLSTCFLEPGEIFFKVSARQVSKEIDIAPLASINASVCVYDKVS